LGSRPQCGIGRAAWSIAGRPPATVPRAGGGGLSSRGDQRRGNRPGSGTSGGVGVAPASSDQGGTRNTGAAAGSGSRGPGSTGPGGERLALAEAQSVSGNPQPPHWPAGLERGPGDGSGGPTGEGN